MPTGRRCTPARLVPLIAAGIAATITPACTTTPAPQVQLPVAVDRPRPPADLTIDVVVFPDDSGRLGDTPTRFLLEPDGQLRVSTGIDVDEDHYPHRARRLTESQMLDLYARVRRDGLDIEQRRLAEPFDAEPDPFRPEDLVPAHSAAIRVTVTAHGDRTSARHHPSTSPRAVALVQRLRSLSRIEPTDAHSAG